MMDISPPPVSANPNVRFVLKGYRAVWFEGALIVMLVAAIVDTVIFFLTDGSSKDVIFRMFDRLCFFLAIWLPGRRIVARRMSKSPGLIHTEF